MANIFNEELTKGLIKTKERYDATEHVDFATIADGIYDVKIENIAVKLAKNSDNPMVVIESSDVDTGEIISSLFVFSKDTFTVSLQSLRNLLVYCNIDDFTNKELKDSTKMESKLEKLIGHQVKLELKTAESGFQSTSFVASLDEDSEDEEDEEDDE